MATSNLEQYRVSDLLEWHEKKALELNPEFQRGNVWTPAAKTYLIDTILRRLPIPKIYMRTKVNVAAKTSTREIVDGQQRLRAVIDFANNKFSLGPRAKEFAGLRYDDLSDEQKETFLSYSLAVDQLINASDDDVLEIFSRLNSYNVPLNPPELRHATYQGPFKWSVYDSTKRWEILWDQFKVVSVRQRLRMLDNSLSAEMYGVILEGITDGGQNKIKKIYDRYDREFPEQEVTVDRLDRALDFITTSLADALAGTLAGAPHFLMLFSAVAHCQQAIPPGELDLDVDAVTPPHDALQNIPQIIENLATLNAAIDDVDTAPERFRDFVRASKASTQRIASRRVRFPLYLAAMGSTRI